jgi:adenylate cyclase
MNPDVGRERMDLAAGDTPIAELNTRQNLTKLLDELGEHPERIEDITHKIEEDFGQDRTILILDMSGFTRATREGSVISFLLSINQMQRLALPVIEEHGGICVRAEHDNLTCLFDRVNDALVASNEITERLESANVILPSDRELYVAIGIGFGTILNVQNEAIYGNEVNLASKLGEDIAGLGEVLLTPSAFAHLDEGDFDFEDRSVSISGLQLDYHALTRRSP